MQLKIYSSDGQSCREIECAQIPQFEGTRGIQAVRDTVLAYQANRRQGNACTKQRGEVSGTGKKPWRQKGTGMARHGSRRSPIWPGGGIVFGPRPRDYSQKINRKVKTLALSRALFDIAHGGGLNLIEAFKVAEPKTRVFHKVLENIFPVSGKVLIVDDCFDDTIVRAARNLERIYFAETASVNAWDFVRFQKVIISEKALDTLISRLNSEEA